MNKTYICIDLKSFYASVECNERHLDPLTTNLVVADLERTEKTICLAVSPALKRYGIPGRARLFEVNQRVREVNKERLKKCAKTGFLGKSISSIDLDNDNELELDFIAAKPRMSLYIKYSSKIYSIYLKYIAKEDIHVYSIDEVFMDVTSYLNMYKMSAHDLCRTIISDILKETGITATGGIGTNMYLAKVAMDIVAKHIPADKDGVRIAELDEMSYREKLWTHEPLTDFWRVGKGISKRLNDMGIRTMGDLALASTKYENALFSQFGINAELLIDHAWGYEPTTIADVKAYKPDNSSYGTGQVLHCATPYDTARLIVHEMADQYALDLVEQHLVASSIFLAISYDKDNLKTEEQINSYDGELSVDYYGRLAPKAVHGGMNLGIYTSSAKVISEALDKIFVSIVDKSLLIRRINISGQIFNESDVSNNKETEQLDLFTDYDKLQHQQELFNNELKKEKKSQEAILSIRKKYGKNSVLKGMNLEEGATQMDRNEQIGGHKA